MRLPRSLLLVLWAVLTLFAYYLLLFTPWSAYAPAGVPLRTILTEACVVLAAFTCLEVLRSEERVQLRALAGAVGFPLAVVLLLTMWIGLRRYLQF
ncbi:hypothetical protein HHL11_15960 [Ramlibacter sp. G-1-2-2]|uniref:Uncharacterized protein n=1 Tax=Ramlibacter agri TaxID=2728837 RepID=A0A848H7C1_9BURK|nr:hypothetical protein [Ramlibacter agri]NML45250.1 hypothetical protein [Ramlibacter agri]